MKKIFTLALAVIFLSVPILVGASVEIAAQAEQQLEPKAEEVEVENIIEFNNMMPVSGPFVGADLFGVTGASADYALDSAKGSLDASGNLEIDVKGLVLADSGMNVLESFFGLVTCAAADGTISSVSTGAFPADADGNANIKEMLVLPSPCAAPAVFVTNPDGDWLAVTGAAAAQAQPAPEEPPEEPEEPEEPGAAMAELG